MRALGFNKLKIENYILFQIVSDLKLHPYNLVELFLEQLNHGNLDDTLRKEVHREMQVAAGFELYAPRGDKQSLPDVLRNLYEDICKTIPMANELNRSTEDEESEEEEEEFEDEGE